LKGALIKSAHGLRATPAQGRSWPRTLLGTGLAAACAAGIGAGFVIAPLTATDSLSPPMDPAEVAASTLGDPIEVSDV
jgi:hypothetical protein